MRKRIRIISNPVSGQGRAARKAREVMLRLVERGCAVEVVETRRAGDARRIAGEARSVDALVAVGGDGTINEVANGCVPPSGPPLGIIPSGTANVLAKEIGLPRRPGDLAGVIASGREIAWDAGRIRPGDQRFLLFVSAGFDAQVVHAFHKRRDGRIRMSDYLAWGVRTYMECPIPKIRVELDGVLAADQAAWVVVSNVRSYGGPIVLTPDAKYDDGRFEVMIQRRRHKADTALLFGASVLRWAFDMDARPADVTCHPARKVRLASADGHRVALQVDGDPGGFLPVELEVEPGGIRILGPGQRS
ncbi:MAG TPA: diacylglycerol kinase family protein [Candidatus Eisenbacteria bacterium]|nr:diacylglycerol kinase family protein [Candidatus Eisenbacteria bacterium]